MAPPDPRPPLTADAPVGPDGAVAPPALPGDQLLAGSNLVVRRRHPRGRPAAGGGGGPQDAVLTHHRPPHPRPGVSLFEILAITFYQQGRRRDEVAGRRWWGRWPRRCGCRRPTRPACASCGATPTSWASPQLHDLRPGRRQQADRLRHPRPGLDTKRFPSRSARAWRAPRTTGSTPSLRPAGGNLFERKIAEVFTESRRLLRAGLMDFDDLGQALRLLRTPRRAAALPAPVQAHPGRRVPGHEPGAERLRPAARRRPPQRRGRRRPGPVDIRLLAAPTCATSSSSRTPSPTRRWCCSSRTTGRRRPSSTPPTPSSPTTWAASPRSCGPTTAPATPSCATTPTTRSTRRSGSPEIARLHDRDEVQGPDGGDLRWGDVAVFYRTNAQSRVLEEQPMRRHPLQGGGRHPLLRPQGDQGRHRLPAGGGQPGRRGVDQAGPQRAQAGSRGHVGRPARRLRHRPGLSFIDALRRADDAGVGGSAIRGIQAFLTLLDDVADLAAGSPGPLLEQLLERSGYLDQLEAERTIEAEGRSRTWPSWSAQPARPRRSPSSSNRSAWWPTPTTSTTTPPRWC